MNEVRKEQGRDAVAARIEACQRLVGSDINFAFQTIIDASEQEVVGFEALVRGIDGEPAATVISRISHDQRFDFDQACRIRAIEAAARFGVEGMLHLNCSDVKLNNIGEVIDVCLHMASQHAIRPDQIVLELGNLNMVAQNSHLAEIRKAIRNAGFHVLADNFGRRNADLKPIAYLEPSLLKLDYHLVHGIHRSRQAQAIVRGTLALCADRGIDVMAAGVESAEEFRWLHNAGIKLFQGYYFAQPGMDETGNG